MSHSTDAPRVYIIDDDDAVRSGLKMLAHAQGWDVQDFHSAAAFLDESPPANGVPTCLVVDLQMPGMDGAELLETLQSNGDMMSSIVLTARPDGRLARRALAAGAEQVISKPFEPRQWVEIVRAVLQSG